MTKVMKMIRIATNIVGENHFIGMYSFVNIGIPDNVIAYSVPNIITRRKKNGLEDTAL